MKESFTQEKIENSKLKSKLLNAEYYYATYPEVLETGMSAEEHFDIFGWKELKNPSRLFDTARYLDDYQDVKDSGLNPLTHYITFGHLENRKIYPVDEANNQSSESKGTEATSEERNSIEAELLLKFFFDEEYYLAENEDIKKANIDPLEHFMNYGWKEYRNPSIYFNVSDYLEKYSDIKKAEINPLIHYIYYGRHEGRKLVNATPSKNRFSNVYSTLNTLHAGGSTAPEYAPCISTPVAKDNAAPKIIAFYLPQFHPFKENDEWWGKGFTEWTNVAKAVPQFEGHYQPRLPSDLGYYDLRLTEVMEEQTKMAAAHGVDGFCFHYYWFAGHRLMERPIEQYLAEKENLDFPFCLCWANENWSRRWDGSENDILIAQEHSKEDNKAVFYDLLRHFKDERYITVEGKPILVIYRPDIIPDIKGLVSQLQILALKEGLPGIHLVATNAFGFNQHKELGFDAIVEFPPHNVHAGSIRNEVVILNDEFSGHIYQYDNVVDYSLARLDNMEKEAACSYYPTVMTGWDNSARKPGKGNVFHNATPAKFQRWFEGVYRWSQYSHPQGAKFVFVNAWNEWAEGTYLEPDKKYGYAYLNAVRTTINEALINEKQLDDFASTIQAEKKSDSVVVAHVFYEDLVDEICNEIIKAREFKKLDVAISIPNSFSIHKAQELVERLHPVKMIVSENRGRDIWPFLQTIKALKGMKYKYGCKIHSKKSTHLANGAKWRHTIYEALLSKPAIKAFDEEIEYSDCYAILSPAAFMVELKGDSIVDNNVGIEKLMSIYSIKCDNYAPFVAGSMFWFSFEWAEKLEHKGVNRVLFGPELGAIDGTIAHAFERFFTTHAIMNEFEVGSYYVATDYLPYH